jgi:hypothetical protein
MASITILILQGDKMNDPKDPKTENEDEEIETPGDNDIHKNYDYE